MTEQVATYYYDMQADYGVYDVFAIYETEQDYSERNVSYYEVFNKNGECMNEGSPLYSFPTFLFVKIEYYDSNLTT